LDPAGVLEAERGFRKLAGYRATAILVAALRAHDAQLDRAEGKLDTAKNAAYLTRQSLLNSNSATDISLARRQTLKTRENGNRLGSISWATIASSRTGREIAWVALGSLAFALCIFYRFFGRFSRLIAWSGFGRFDWDYHMQLHWVIWYTITHFHQFPFWNPYKCGGMPLLGNPQSPILTPFLLPDLLFGPVIGLHLGSIVHVAIAFGGAYFLARVLGISRLGAVACAGAFAGNSGFYMYYEWGDWFHLSLAYAPWAIALLWVGSEQRRLIFAAVGGLVMAQMVMEGGLYQLLFTATMLGVLAPALALQRRSWFPLLLLAITGAFAAGFIAVKLLPGLAFTGLHSTVRNPGEGFSIPYILIALFSHDQQYWMPNDNRTILTAYIGILFGGLALLGGALRFRRAFPWVILAFLLLGMARGNFSESYSPWVLLHKLPFFASMRSPERWLIPFTLAAAVLAGFGTDTICKVAKPWGAIAATLLIGLAIMDTWYVAELHLSFLSENYAPFENVLRPEASAAWADPTFRQFYDANLFGITRFTHFVPESRMTSAAQANRGVLVCYEDEGLVPNTQALGYNQAGYQGEQYLLGPGKLTLSRWTPNALSFDIDVPAPTVMVVNQNYDPGWYLAQGQGMVVSKYDLIGVEIPAGKQQIVLAYGSRPFLIGLGITLATFVMMLLLWLYERLRGGEK
jgi:hypothetical protein